MTTMQHLKTKRIAKYEIDNAEIEKLCSAQAPKPGFLPQTYKRFDDLPLSTYTMEGLKRGGFKFLTRIQKSSIIHSLAGRDVLASAKTGSGKTLAFLIPLLEKIYLSRWTQDLGVAAIIITPTRELAIQIYEVLRVVGFKHDCTVGLFIGSGGKNNGNSFKYEQKRARLANILVCTPGKLLQHLEQTADLKTSDTSLLILDEADRLLDMGFLPQLTKILSYLPQPTDHYDDKSVSLLRRQTLLFSATQTRSIKKLAKLSLVSPEVILAHEESTAATPTQLTQIYSIVPLERKLEVLYSFIRSHLRSKIIVFCSTCKQVQFMDSVFRKLQPGIRILALHGKLKQTARMDVYYSFIEDSQPKSKIKVKVGKRKSTHGACLLATDVVARGLDFPSIDWVVQLDCPENTEMYIHRVGRTARYRFNGKGLLLLTEREAQGFIPMLKAAKVPILKKEINESRVLKSTNGIDLTKKLSAEVAKNVEVKLLAQKAFKSYIRSVHLQPNKTVFDVKQLPFASFAKSLGLSSTPRVKVNGLGGMKERLALRKVKNVTRLPSTENMKLEDVSISKQKQRIIKRKSQQMSNIDTKDGFSSLDKEAEDDGDIFTVKRTLLPLQIDNLNDFSFKSTKALKKVKIGKDGLQRGRIRGTRTVFDAQGNIVSDFATNAGDTAENFLENAKGLIQANLELDRKDERVRLQKKRKKYKKELDPAQEAESLVPLPQDDSLPAMQEDMEDMALRLIED